MQPNYLDGMAIREFELNWNSLGLSKYQAVRDLWRQKDLGIFKDTFSVKLPENGVCLIKVKSLDK